MPEDEGKVKLITTNTWQNIVRNILVFFGIWKRYVAVDITRAGMVVCVIVRKWNGDIHIERITGKF